MSTTTGSIDKKITTEGTSSGSMIYFRFEGKLGTGVDSVDVTIPLATLKSFPDTLLAKLSEDTWNNNNNNDDDDDDDDDSSSSKAGETKENPLISKPMDGPCMGHWSTSLAHVIVNMYNFQHTFKQESNGQCGQDASSYSGFIVDEVYNDYYLDTTLSSKENKAKMNSQNDDGGGVDEAPDGEPWDLVEILSEDVITQHPIPCDSCPSGLKACVVYQGAVSKEKWHGCLDCQEDEFGEWPEKPDDYKCTVKNVSDSHKRAMVEHCSNNQEHEFPDFAAIFGPSMKAPRPTLPPSMKAPRPTLPPAVDLEDALFVLDYYGFPISDEEHIRAKLQVKELSLVEQAKEFVVSELKQNPQRETLFLFASQNHDMDHINKHNKFSRRILSTGKVVRVGGNTATATGHYGWAQVPSLQQLFMGKLKKALPGFEVKFLHQNFANHDNDGIAQEPLSYMEISDEGGMINLQAMLLFSVHIPAQNDYNKRKYSAS